MPSAFPILFGIIHVPFDSFISQNEGNAEFEICFSNAVLEHLGREAAQRRFIAECLRVARRTFICVPHRYFPVEHHTALPVLHWFDLPFRAAARLTGNEEWTQPENLILMTRSKLRSLVPEHFHAVIGYTGINLGPFSSNMFMHLESAGAFRDAQTPHPPQRLRHPESQLFFQGAIFSVSLAAQY